MITINLDVDPSVTDATLIEQRGEQGDRRLGPGTTFRDDQNHFLLVMRGTSALTHTATRVRGGSSGHWAGYLDGKPIMSDEMVEKVVSDKPRIVITASGPDCKRNPTDNPSSKIQLRFPSF